MSASIVKITAGRVARTVARQAFGLAILACAVVSFSFPGCFHAWFGVKLTSLVVPAIQIIMFGMGTTLSLDDFRRVAKCQWTVFTGVSLQFLVMPLVGFALAKTFGLTGEVAAGCVLVGSVAGGTASNVIAYLARANVALSVTMTCCSTLLSPFLTPLAMKFLAGRFVAVDACAMFVSILEVVLVPVVAGGLFRRVFRRTLETRKAVCDRILSTVSMTGICFTILALTAPSRATFREAGALIVAAAVLHNTIGFASGYWLTRLLGRWLPLGETDARTVAIEVGMQNGGMAGALAVGVLGSAVAALPANVFSIWMNFSGSLIAGYWSRRPSK
ncbi:MAG: bile acid:sodium symporter family protein [Kiritimatiellae bacterium]|nr:bile acid:sodium symporter family protein [Kiritimatiellia bacterium]